MRSSKFGYLCLAILGAIYFNNASWLAASQNKEIKFLSHRGVHQTYHRENLTNDTCTAERIFEPEHSYLENTIASMRAAFDAGAHMVEIDIHPTTDGRIAVFHDWTLNCRTNQKGVTRKQSWSYLKTLDIGYGYTADNGVTYPFRGKGIGLMPSLSDVFRAFPNKKFLINFKSKDRDDADKLAAVLKANPKINPLNLMVYGGEAPTNRLKSLVPKVRGFTKSQVKACLQGYAATGWSGHVPKTCQNTAILIPANYTKWLWGWPHKFVSRMESAGTDVFLAGRLSGSGAAGGIDTEEQFSNIPQGYSGWIWTNRIIEAAQYFENISKHSSN